MERFGLWSMPPFGISANNTDVDYRGAGALPA
jgi:hypothetical protein